MHFLSENTTWVTESEFVDENGTICKATGESRIEVSPTHITNQSVVRMEDRTLTNDYDITRTQTTRYTFESRNPSLGLQKGVFDIDRQTIYSKFIIDNTSLNGFEVIRRDGDECTAYGALYKGNTLINTWTAHMQKKTEDGTMI